MSQTFISDLRYIAVLARNNFHYQSITDRKRPISVVNKLRYFFLRSLRFSCGFYRSTAAESRPNRKRTSTKPQLNRIRTATEPQPNRTRTATEPRPQCQVISGQYCTHLHLFRKNSKVSFWAK